MGKDEGLGENAVGGKPPWPDEAYEQFARHAGRIYYGLLFSERRWVHRRTETLDVLSHELARRSVSVDFTIPRQFRSRIQLKAESQWLVPLTMLPKQPLWNFDLRAEGGEAVPALGQQANALIAEETLLAAARSTAGVKSVEALPEDLRTALREVAAGDPETAKFALTGILGKAGEGEPAASALVKDPRSALLIELLAKNYLLIALVDVVDRRRVLKYAHDHELITGPGGRSLTQRLGWKPLVIETAAPSAARTVSYHAEIQIPEELRLDGSFIYDRKTKRVYAVDGPGDRGSLHAPHVPPSASPVLVFAVRPERVGFPTIACLVAWVTAAFLIVGAWPGHLDPNRADAAVSLLLAGSALFAGVAASSGEHRLVQTQFSLPRLALAASALIGLGAASALAFALPSCTIAFVWRLGAIFAVIFACILSVTFKQAAPATR